MTGDPEGLAKLDLLIEMGRDVRDEQKIHADRLARLEGKHDVMPVWLQSMDQRFGALMAPVTPPKKPAA